MAWTKEELSQQLLLHSKEHNGMRLIDLDGLGKVFSNPNFPKEEGENFLGLLNAMKELENDMKNE